MVREGHKHTEQKGQENTIKGLKSSFIKSLNRFPPLQNTILCVRQDSLCVKTPGGNSLFTLLFFAMMWLWRIYPPVGYIKAVSKVLRLNTQTLVLFRYGSGRRIEAVSSGCFFITGYFLNLQGDIFQISSRLSICLCYYSFIEASVENQIHTYAVSFTIIKGLRLFLYQ